MFCNLEFEEIITVPELRLVKLLSPFGFLLFQNVQNVTISKGSDGMVKIKMKCGHPIFGSDQTFILSAKSLVQTIDSAC